MRGQGLHPLLLAALLLLPPPARPVDAASAPALAAPGSASRPSPSMAPATLAASEPAPAASTPAVPALDPSLPRWRALRVRAAAQAKAGDTAGLHATLEALAPLMPGSPRITYNLAATEARLGRRDDALQHLRQLADGGLEYDLSADDDFADLAGDPEFRALRQRLAAGAQRTGAPRTLLALPADDAIPEAISPGPDGRWWVGSVRHCDVRDLAIPLAPAAAPASARASARSATRAGTRTTTRRGHAAPPRGPVAHAPIHLPAPVFGLAWDAPRGVLWATVAAVPQGGGCGDASAWQEGRTALLGLDVSRGGKLWRQVESPVPGVLGDLTVGPDGTVYVSESLHGAVFRLRPGRASLERLDPPGEFASPQQPVLGADGHTLLVPDYVRGLATLDLSTTPPTLRWLPAAPGVFTAGIDGLVRDGDALLAVQNGTSPPRVVRFSMDGRRQQVLVSGTPGLGEPTHGVVLGREFVFVSDVGWDRYDDEGQRRADMPAARPAVQALALP